MKLITRFFIVLLSFGLINNAPLFAQITSPSEEEMNIQAMFIEAKIRILHNQILKLILKKQKRY